MSKRIVFLNDSAGPGREVPECLSAFDRFDIAQAAAVLAPLLSNDATAASLLVAVWGGDGSIRTVAGHLVGTSATLLACPGGTHNHFARTLGISNEQDVADALEGGEEHFIDVGTAGSEVFLNGLSLGWYTDLVSRRERYQRHMSRRLAKITSLPVQLVRTRRLRVRVDHRPERVWLVWVGNGEYSLSSTRLTDRESMEGGVLDVRILRAGARWPKLRALVAVVKGNTESSSHIVRELLASTTLQTQHPSVRAALDGELVDLASPVQIALRRRSLCVLVPVRSVENEAVVVG